MRQTYHIEAVGLDAPGRGADIVQRISVRADSLAAVEERAMRLFRRLRAPQRQGPDIEAIRILDGAGTEMFRWSVFDDMSRAAR